MRVLTAWKACLGGALCAVVLALAPASAAWGAASDPLFVLTTILPSSLKEPAAPPPTGYFNAPCGITVDVSGRYYVSDYHHHTIDLFSGQAYVGQLTNEDPTDGPCGLALDSTNHLYVNNYHRNVVKFGAYPAFGAGTLFALPEDDPENHLPTGVAVDPTTDRVYVDHRTYISVYDSSGTPIEEGGEPLRIGMGSLGDGYGVAVSGYGPTFGFLYVPDAATNTVKVYNPTADKANPIATLKDPFGKPFVSLKDSAIAVDRVSGQIYFADNLQPKYTERPQAEIYAYTAANIYNGHLKYNVIDALPPGLAVDNSAGAGQGRVYVTSGNTDKASVYAYGAGAQTTAAPLPPLDSGLAAPTAASSASGEAKTVDGSLGSSAGTSATASTVTQKEDLRVSVEGRLSPKTLPRKGSAPISVSVGWDIASVDESPPPRLKGLRIEINREGRFETEGLPACPYTKIQPATTQRALSNCRSALVGRGSFEANVALRGQEGESYPAKGRLLVFNGEEKGKPVLFGQIYSAHPFATSFVIVFQVQKIKKGDYGTVLTATLPPSLRSWGNLTGIEMNLSRRYSYEGKQRSYVSAGCPAPKGFRLASFKLARTSFSFSGGRELSAVVTGDCRARG